MKRDMDLVRKIALTAADAPFGMAFDRLDGVDPADFGMHVMWMQEAGLLKAAISEYQSGEPPAATVLRLTWEGCEFADAARNDTLWNKAKGSVIKPTASFTFGLIKEWLASEIRNNLPTLRG